MNSLTSLAKSRIKFNKSRTVFTVISIMLTTLLLMSLGTSVVGLINNQKYAVSHTANHHARMKNLTARQLNLLTNHVDVEAVEASEIFARIQYEKMTGFLSLTKAVKGSVFHSAGNLTEGRLPEAPNEICGPPAFFERIGTNPEIGNTLSITFRPGETEYVTREFTICGLVSQADVSKLNVSDDRIAYGASVSEALIREFFPEEERSFSAAIRVNGENNLNYDAMKARIASVAEDIGLNKDDLDFNTEYLMVMTDPGQDILAGSALIALIIALFAGLVIYSIYYVSVITDVQEIGKLKALGASKKQIRRLLQLEGLFASLIALPVGLVLGYLIPKLGLPMLMDAMSKYSVYAELPEGGISMFSLPVTLGVILVVLVTVFLSLLKPLSMASKISPVEAIRYQETSSDKRKEREGCNTLNLTRLSWANLARNKKRTVVTIVTMGLSCVLFISLAAVANSMSIDDFARRTLPEGDFMISLDASYNDKTYPENNLDRVQMHSPFDDALLNKIKSIPGVTAVDTENAMLAGADSDSEVFAGGTRAGIGCFTREDIPKLKKDLKRGDLDYDALLANHGLIYCYDTILEKEGFSMNQRLSLSFFRGDKQIPFNGEIAASGSWGKMSFMLPKELFDQLAGDLNTTIALYIHAEPEQFDAVKAQLQEITGQNQLFKLYSMDEERDIAKLSINMIKYPMYAILILIGIISFMNLINTMVTSIITRKRELAMLQAIGLSDKQLVKMLSKEGMVFTMGTLLAALTAGNLLGYLVFLYGRNTGFMEVQIYHYPLIETIGLGLALILGQMAITFFISKRIHKESLVTRMRSGE